MGTNLRLAVRALFQNRLQALLTLSGMSIGVAMVVIVSGLGRGAQQQIESQIESAGPTMITVQSGNFRPVGITSSGEQDSSGGEVSEGGFTDPTLPFGPEFNMEEGDVPVRPVVIKKTKVRSPALPLRNAELDMLSNDIEGIRLVAASLSGNLTLDEQAGNPVRIARLFGYQHSWPDMQGWELLYGRMLTAREHEQSSPLVLVSAGVARRLWPEAGAAENTLGKTLAIAGETLTVVGIVNDKSDEGSTIIVPTLYLPLYRVQSLLCRESFDQINVRTRSVGVTTQVAGEIKQAMRNLRELPEDTLDDFRINTQSVSAMPSMGMDPRLARAVHSNVVEFEQESWEEMAMSLRQAGRTFTLLLSAAAAVSLLVGGIGVMNIMLVSVAARTREIGLRMALGARMSDVLLQFMVEAVTLAALGGVIGLLLGTAGLMMVDYGLSWATSISPLMLILAVAMATATGVVFGYGPARRAAQLDPVVALKSE